MKDFKKIQRWLSILVDIKNETCGTVKNIAEKHGVSERTISKDMKELNQVGIPLYYDRKDKKYLMAVNAFLPPVNFSLIDCLMLKFMLSSINEQGKLNTLIEKLNAINPEKVAADRKIPDTSVKMQMTKAKPLTLKYIYESIARKKKLKFTYTMPSADRRFRIYVDPHGVCFVKRAWYLVAYYPPQEALRFYRINRMENMEILEDDFEMMKDFDLESMLSDAWNMMQSDKKYDVKINFTKDVAYLIKEVEWHKTQKITEKKDGSILFEVTVPEINELRYWILSFAHYAEVMEPEFLRNLVKEDVKKMHRKYFN